MDNIIPVVKIILRLLLSRLQGNKPHRNFPEPSEPYLRNSPNTRRNSLEPSGTFRTLPPEPTPTRAGTLQTLRNLPRPSGTNLSEPSGTYLLNLRQHTLEPSEIFRNLPPEATPLYTGILRNLPEPSGTCLRNLHQHTPELSGTFRNLPPELAPATRAGTHRSLSGLKTPLAYAVGEKNLRTCSEGSCFILWARGQNYIGQILYLCAPSFAIVCVRAQLFVCPP